MPGGGRNCSTTAKCFTLTFKQSLPRHICCAGLQLADIACMACGAIDNGAHTLSPDIRLIAALMTVQS